MKVAVTGGSGQLGTHVIRRLAADRSVTEIVSIDLRPPRLASKKLKPITADVRDDDFARHLEGCDALIHMAFIVTGRSGVTFDAVNIGGSKNVFQAAAAAGVKKILYTSSIAAYGVVPGHPVPIVESTPRVAQPSFPYSLAKYKVEEFLDGFEKEHPDIAVIRFRPAILVGGYMEHSLGDALKRRVIVDLGRTPPPLVWDEDVADAIVLALKKDVRGAFNLGADDSKPIAELATQAGLRVIHPSPAVLRAGKTFLTWRGRLGFGRAEDPSWLENTSATMVMDCSRAVKELGWKRQCPTALDVLKRYVETIPTEQNRKLAVFFKLLTLASSRRELPAETRRLDARLHLALTGPDGGDFDITLKDGRITAKPGIPRPPTVTVTMKATTFLDLLAGRLDYSTAQLTGKIRIEGEALAGMLVQGLVTIFREQAAQSGLAAWPARRLAAWMAA